MGDYSKNGGIWTTNDQASIPECPHHEIQPVGPGRSEYIAGDCVACNKPLRKTETEIVDGKLVFKPFVYTRPVGKSRPRWKTADLAKLQPEKAEVTAPTEPLPIIPPVTYTPDEWWFNCVHTMFLAGCNNVTAPMTELSEKSAVEVAMWMKANLLTKGGEYVFSRTKEGTIIHKGQRIENEYGRQHTHGRVLE